MLSFIYLITLIVYSYSQNCRDYIVKSGDNAWSIVRYNCKDIYQCDENNYIMNSENELCPYYIYPNEVLKLCCQDNTSPSPSPSTSQNNNYIDYTVESGDHSWKIVNNICNANNCDDDNYILNNVGEKCPYNIYVGEKVKVYCKNTTPTMTPTITSPTSTPSSNGDGNGKILYFTIDDGPSTARNNILDVLNEVNVKVSFFDSGYNLCKDHSTCSSWSYETNIDSFKRTIEEGHFMGSHSDNHYYNPQTQRCDYINVKPFTRDDECGFEPIQNMVEGAKLLQNAIESRTWSDNTLKQKTINDVWTKARLPCSNIWRLPQFSGDFVNEGANENQMRIKVADEMYSGNVKCRTQTTPWKIYGFDANMEWRGNMMNVDQVYNMIVSEFSNTKIQNKGVLLTHDYLFDTTEKIQVLKNVLLRLKQNGFTLDTLDTL